MIINQKKLERQLLMLDRWVGAGAKGTCEAVTAFGKTYMAILAIKRLHKKYPQARIIVVLPGTDLANAWNDKKRGHIVKHGLHNVEAWVINTYIRYHHECELLILDEVHNYASEEFKKVFSQTTYKFILGLTATLERIDGKHAMLEEKAPIIDSVSLAEAKREGYVSDFNTYNWGLELSDEDKEAYGVLHSTFNNCFAYFKHDFELAMACTFGNDVSHRINNETEPVPEEQRRFEGETRARYITGAQRRQEFAQRMEWDGSQDHFYTPANISKKAQQWRAAMAQRKDFIYTASVKVEAIQQLVDKFPCKTIIFSEKSHFADKIEQVLGRERCRAYHTNLQSQIVTERKESINKDGSVKVTYKDVKYGKDRLKKMILESFSDKDGLQIVAAVRALDEGYDNDKIEMAISASYSSSKRQDTQRSGRGIRLNPDNVGKTSLLVNLYIVDTQEEKWLKEKQRGKQDIAWVDSIHEITRDTYGGLEI